jgi:serine/threonine protein kinase
MAFSLADYEIQEEIGRGGFATVYRARQKSLNKTVAIKCLAAPRQQNSEQIVRFRREAEATASLAHDNIITVFDYAFFNGSYYIVMEYIDGFTLNTALECSLPRPSALCVLEKIASALRAAHERGVIHRDVKPANILIGRQGQVKLADFGLAVFPGGVETQSAAGSVLGTLCYLAPEALVSPREVDSRVDIFALGCILYRILTGKLPFIGDTVGELSHRLLNEPAMAIDERTPLAAITMRCLEKERDKRPSADEVYSVLHEAIAEQYHECTKKLLSFIADYQCTVSHDNREERPIVADTGFEKRDRPIKKPAFVITVTFIGLLAAALFLTISHKRMDTPALPRLPRIDAAINVETSDVSPSPKAGPAAIPDAPAPLTGAALDAEIATVELYGITPTDSIFLDGIFSASIRAGDRINIKASPGRHHIDVRRNGKRLLARNLELLPYERMAIDLHNGRKSHDSSTID